MSHDNLEKTTAMAFDNEELKTLVQTLVQETTLLQASSDGAGADSDNDGPGTKGQRYAIGTVLGSGGMGVVLQAHDKNLDRGVAMKVLQKARVTDSGHALRFIREAEITGSLEHPNIIPLHELGLDAGSNAYYTMKQVKGDTLKAILKRLNADDPETVANYPFRRLLEIFLKVCDAMSLAHSQGVVHRDLKPENIMVGSFGEVLVIDWGLAKRVDMEDEPPCENEDAASSENPMELVTQVGAIMGTPSYMSPEQALGRNVGPQSDVFSLGAILYSILTFTPPVTGKNVNELFARLLKGDFKTPEERWRSRADGKRPSHLPGGVVAPGISAVTMKALAAPLKDRYASVEALKRDIETFQAGHATGAEQASLLRQLGLLVKRHRKAISAVVVFGLGLALYGALFAFQLKQERDVAKDRQKAAVEAMTLVKKNRAAALIVFDKLKSKTPTIAQQARYELENNDLESALTLINNAIILNSENGDLYQLKGDILQNQFKFDQSTEAYAKALQLKGQIPGLIERKAASRKFAAVRWESPTERLKVLNRHMVEVGRYRESLNLLSSMEYNVDDYFTSGEPFAKSKNWDVRTNVLQYGKSWDIRYHKGGKGIYMNIKRCGSFFDLREIGNLGITSLSVSHPKFITGWETLASQRSLATLNIVDAKHIDLAQLRGLKVRTLKIHSEEVENLDLVGEMGVEYLTLIGKGITDDTVTGIDGAGITRLTIEDVGLTNLDFLKNFPSLSSLTVSDPKISSLPLSHLALSYLNLSRVKIASLDGINPSALRHLRISSTPLNNLESFRKHQFPQLEKLYISWCPLSDISPLKNLAQLNELSIFDTRVSDLSPLTGHRLNKLDFRSTAVSDLTPLKGCAPKHIELSLGRLSDTNIRFLRSLNIRTINSRRAREFWRKYDETQNKKRRQP